MVDLEEFCSGLFFFRGFLVFIFFLRKFSFGVIRGRV